MELADHFGLKVNLNRLDHGALSDYLYKRALLGDISEENRDRTDRAITACRVFLAALESRAKVVNYVAPLWAGLQGIEDDQVFLEYFIKLLPHMWV